MAIVKVTREMAVQAAGRVDWARQDSLTDAEIARATAADPDAPPILSDKQAFGMLVRSVRHRLGLSQVQFAQRYHIPPGTLRDWEQARILPDKPAIAYMQVIAKEPAMVAAALDPIA